MELIPPSTITSSRGVTDLAALQEGLVGDSSTATTTGVVASVALQGEARSIVIAGSTTDTSQQTAYMATGTYGLGIIDVSNDHSPTILSQMQLDGTATDVGVDPNLQLAAIADGPSGLVIVDVSKPISPVLVQTIAIDATTVQVLDGMAYANDGSTLDAVDLASGEVLQKLTLTSATLTGLAIDGTTLYAMDASNRLTVIDLSSGKMVVDGARVVLPAGGGRLFVANGVAYVPTNDIYSGGYLTVDVSSPSAPKLIQSVQDAGIESGAIALNGSGLGVAVGKDGGGPAGVVGVDVVNTTSPANTGQFITRYTLPPQPQDPPCQ